MTNSELVEEIKSLLSPYSILIEKDIDYEVAETFAIWFLDEQQKLYEEFEKERAKELKEIIDFVNKKIYEKK